MVTQTVTKQHLDIAFPECKRRHEKSIDRDCPGLTGNCLLAVAFDEEVTVRLDEKGQHLYYASRAEGYFDEAGQELAKLFDDAIFGLGGSSYRKIVAMLPCEVSILVEEEEDE